MSAYQYFTSTRTTTPDLIGLLAALRTAVAPELGVVMRDVQSFTLKKTADWTAGEITSAQTILDTFAAVTPQLAAQHAIDAMSTYDLARDLTLIDELNVLRAALRSLGVTGLPDRTPAQAKAAIRAKAGTL